MEKQNSRKAVSLAKSRKEDHLRLFLETHTIESNLFDDVLLMHNALPEMDFNAVDTVIEFLGGRIAYPVMINAITGGFEGARAVNASLARIASRFDLPMAVGSQSLALKGGDKESFRMVREIMSKQRVIANLSANASLDKVRKAIDMIEADAVQLHLNAAQELCMKEGDRDFTGILKNIELVAKNAGVPVIAKEVGFGISGKIARRLAEAGISAIDIGGSGGTNFIEIEDRRNDAFDHSDLYDWGIPTPLSLIECWRAVPDIPLIASGGIRNALDAAKALALGATSVGLAGPLLKVLLTEGEEAAGDFLAQFLHKLEVVMMLTGSGSVDSFKKADWRVSGRLKELIDG